MYLNLKCLNTEDDNYEILHLETNKYLVLY